MACIINQASSFWCHTESERNGETPLDILYNTAHKLISPSDHQATHLDDMPLEDIYMRRAGTMNSQPSEGHMSAAAVATGRRSTVSRPSAESTQPFSNRMLAALTIA